MNLSRFVRVMFFALCIIFNRYLCFDNVLYASNRTENDRPNIVLVLADDLGYGDLSFQGAEDMNTPNIDNIARQGVTFTNFYANSPVCSPSRASLLTGKYPDIVGVPGVIRQEEENSWGYLNENAITLPQILNDVDYHTAMVGKWHLGYEKPNTPNGRGFKHFKGFLGDMMDDYWTHLRGGINWMRLNDSTLASKDHYGHATDVFTDWAIEYLQERKDNEQPFFLYLAYNAPHYPIQPPPEWLTAVRNREPNISEARAKNVALIEHLDYNMGRIMQTLKDAGLDENTLIIFTSDNGGALEYAQSNAPLRGNKTEMYEGGIRVPMYAMWKGKIDSGRTSDNLGMLMDLYPTICEIAGISSLHTINGISLSPALLGESQITDDRHLFWVRREGYDYGGQVYYAARYNGYKILQNSAEEPFQFFNLNEDEFEQYPLTTENNQTYNDLLINLQEHINKYGEIPWQRDKYSGVINYFYANPTVVEEGENATLYWKATDSSVVTLNNQSVGIMDSLIVIPQVTTDYTLIANGEFHDTSTVQITFLPSGLIKSFFAQPPTLEKDVGDSTIIYWETTNNSQVQFEGYPVAQNDSVTVAPEEETTYTLITSGVESDTSQITIELLDAEIFNRSLTAVSFSASSTDFGSSVESAFDSDTTSSWISSGHSAEWLAADLGRELFINRIVINWGDIYAQSYRIEVIDEQNNLSVFSFISDGHGGIDDIGAATVKGKQVRILCLTSSSDEQGYEIKEFEIYGSANDPGTSIETEFDVPAKFELNQNYPNPFNPLTIISYQLPVVSTVDLSIYNILGQKVHKLVSEKQTPGSYSVLWNAHNFASGVYFYRLSTDQGWSQVKKGVLLK